MQWKKNGRQIKQGEEPYKEVETVHSKSYVKVYGEWQTEPYSLSLTENGKLPKNQYGNIEVNCCE